MSHDGKGLSALYARESYTTSGSKSSSVAGKDKDSQKRSSSRFDVRDEPETSSKDSYDRHRDHYRSRTRDGRGGEEEELREEETSRKRVREVDRDDRSRDRHSRSERSDYGRRDDKSERSTHEDRYNRNERDDIYRRTERSDRDSRDERDRRSDYGERRDYRSRDSRDNRDFRDRDGRGESRDKYSRGSDYNSFSNSRGGSSRSSSSFDLPFDQFLRLSPWTGTAIPLEDRVRHLKNWDVAPPGFERISADKAKLTGLFPPPGNITKVANYVPPTLDPARAAMMQLLTGNNARDATTMHNLNNNNTGPNGSTIPASLTKQAKRFYVGNLPFQISELKLQDFLETNLSGLASASPATGENRVTSINVSTDRSYAFIDVRTPEDATMAMNLDGVIFEGNQLKIRRPKEYHLAVTCGGANAHNQNTNNTSNANANANASVTLGSSVAHVVENPRLMVLSGIPQILTAEHVRALLLLVSELRSFLLLKDGETDKSLGVAVFEFIEDEEWGGPLLEQTKGSIFIGPFEMKLQRLNDIYDCTKEDSSDFEDLRNILSIYNLRPGWATAPSSTSILQLLNIVTRPSLLADYDNILADIQTEMQKYSTESVEVFIPQPKAEKARVLVPGVGKVFVKFRAVEEAARAAAELAGRIFDGKTCIVAFYPEESFEKKLF